MSKTTRSASTEHPKLGKYEVLREVGRSTTAIVYEGHDPYIDRPVALKMAQKRLPNSRDLAERFRRRFFREAQTIGGLRHPNIVQVFDAGVHGDRCYIVMEYVSHGATLQPYVQADHLLPIERVVEAAFQSARALEYAHRQGVIHRDIKPSNILLAEDGEAKIGDFGIARLERGAGSATAAMQFAGSPGYMSPEQVQDDPITHQTDLFSLGVVMYECLTGHHPFYDGCFSDLVYRIVNVDAPPMAHHRAEVPEVLERVVRRAMEKDPRRRYKTGLDLASDLAGGFGHLGSPQDEIGLHERFNEARSLGFFHEFTDDQIWEIIRASLWQEFASGEGIFIEGEIDNSFYVVITGMVRVERGGRVVGALGPGDCFGEMGYFSRAKRTASIIAAAHVSLLKISATVLEQTSKDCQLCFIKVFLRQLIRRLSLTPDLTSSQNGS